MVESNSRIIEYTAHNFYLWDIKTNPDSIASSLSKAKTDLISKFETRFFSIGRGDNDSIKSECQLFAEGLSKLIPGLNLTESSIFSSVVSIFNSFHSENMDLYSRKALEIYEEFRKNYDFKLVNKRLIFSDLNLDEERDAFFNDIFELKVFRAEVVAKKFISRFKEFIRNFDDSTANVARTLASKTEEECIYTINNFVFESKRKLQISLSELIDNLPIQRVTVSMLQINISQEEQKVQWEVAYQGLFVAGPVSLKQVLSFGENSVMISLGFNDSNSITIVLVRNFISNPVSGISDKNTVIASGSNLDSLVLFKNTEKKCLVGCIQDDKHFVCINEIVAYSLSTEEIVSAGYFKNSRELLYVSAQGNLGYISFNNKQKDLSQMPKQNSLAIASNCGKFIVLITKSEIFLLDSQMKVVFINGGEASWAIIEENCLKILLIDGQSKISLKVIALKIEESKNHLSQVTFLDKVKIECKKTLQLGEGLVRDILKSNTYAASQAELAPLVEHNKPAPSPQQIVKIQAVWRGYHLRKRLGKHLSS